MSAADGRAGVWWLSPAGAVLLVVPATLVLAVFFDDAYFRQSWGTPKVLTPATAWLFALGAALFCLGALWPLLRSPASAAGGWPQLTAAQRSRLRRAATVVFRLTVVGYLAMAAAGVARGARPAQLLTVLTDQDAFDSTLRLQFAPVTGVTTLTQLGIAYVVLAAVLLSSGRDRGLELRLALVLFLALLRTYFLTERLAVLELLIPLVAVAALAISYRAGRIPARLVQLAPFLLVPAVVAVFSAFEYSRSWVFYSQHRGGSFVQFALDRLAGYYGTAYNNGQLALLHDEGGSVPYGSIEGFWTAPGIAQLHLYTLLTGRSEPDDFSTLLQQYGNPEFNSPGGVAIPFLDYGTVGGLAFFLVVGSLLGLAYRACCDGHLLAVLLYPVLATGLFEMPRYLYWGQGRVLPTLLALLLTWWYVSRARPPRPTSPRPTLRSTT